MLFSFSLLTFTGCEDSSSSNDSIRGSGKVVSESRSVSECSGLALRHSGNVYLTQSDEQSIRIEADDNIIDDVIARNRDGVLEVGLQEGSYSNITLRIYVSLKTIESISIEGAGNIETREPIVCNNLLCSISGTGNIYLKGSGNYLDCLINGAGNLDAQRFIVKKCKAAVNGAGNCTVNVTEELDASVNGVGNITYYGNPPVVRTSITGVGRIVQHN